MSFHFVSQKVSTGRDLFSCLRKVMTSPAKSCVLCSIPFTVTPFISLFHVLFCVKFGAAHALSRQVGVERCSVAPDCFPLWLAVIRQRQPGASWPRFTALWLCCQQGSTTTPGICSHNTHRIIDRCTVHITALRGYSYR